MKVNRGGQRAGGAGGAGGVGIGAGAAGAPKVTPTVVTPPLPSQVAKGNVLPGGGVAFKDFQNMTDDQKADVITKALGVGLPMFLDDSGLQRFAYYTGMSDKPTVVSDAQLDKVSGKTIFRGVHDAYNSRTDIGYSSKDIYRQIVEGDFTMYSDSGGSVHGKAIYFGDSFSTASSYAGSGRNPIVMRGKITSGKVINESTLHSNYRSALNRGDKLALACSNAGSSSAANLYALAKGYSAIYDGYGYTMVLNRGCLTISDTTKSANRRGW